MDLTGTWRVAPADEELRRTFHDVGFDDESWTEIPVPGHWTDEPELRNETSVLFRRTFDHALPEADDGRSWLELDGVCYQGDVWLDGSYLGDTEGYFVRHAFDVTDELRARDSHVLALEVNCLPGGADAKRRSLLGIFEGENQMVPAGNPGGIWAPVRLRHTGPVRIENVRAICEQATTAQAVVAIRAMLVTPAPRSVRLVTEIAGVNHEAEHTVAAGHNEVEWRVTIPDPDLWWPHSLGPQPMYELSVRAETDPGMVSDQYGQRLGLRSVDVRRWQFTINGERMFIKGINVGPRRVRPWPAPRTRTSSASWNWRSPPGSTWSAPTPMSRRTRSMTTPTDWACWSGRICRCTGRHPTASGARRSGKPGPWSTSWVTTRAS